MNRLNCWEFEKCGREPGGLKQDSGICPAATEKRLDGVHEGKNAGRACWVVAGTVCGGQVQGTFAKKYKNCEACKFYQTVLNQEGARFKLNVNLLQKLRETGAPA